MNKIIDKCIVFLICTSFYIPNQNGRYVIVSILLAIIVSALISYFDDRRLNLGLFVVYIGACLTAPIFLFYLPLLCYDGLSYRPDWRWAIAVLPIFVHLNQLPFVGVTLLFSFIAIALLLKYRTYSFEKLENRYIHFRDESKENLLLVEAKHKALIEKQDYELHLATLTERNRIARDIHDNVGHLLSRSILQVGALATISGDNTTKEGLKTMQETLSSAMDSIRNSVHDLHEQSFDLEAEIHKLLEAFTFCEVKLDYEVVSTVDKQVKYCFIAVVKEALANVMRHSNATEVKLTIREHPAFYQLVIQDNGTNFVGKSETGIGIRNINDRVAALHGRINITHEHGFRIFITIQKTGVNS